MKLLPITKKSKRLLIVALVGVIILLPIGALAFYDYGTPILSKPESTIPELNDGVPSAETEKTSLIESSKPAISEAKGQSNEAQKSLKEAERLDAIVKESQRCLDLGRSLTTTNKNSYDIKKAKFDKDVQVLRNSQDYRQISDAEYDALYAEIRSNYLKDTQALEDNYLNTMRSQNCKA